MSEDVVAIWEALYGQSSDKVPTMLVGHSMGGGLVVWAAASKRITSLEGLAVIDVVEGTALGRPAACMCSSVLLSHLRGGTLSRSNPDPVHSPAASLCLLLLQPYG